MSKFFNKSSLSSEGVSDISCSRAPFLFAILMSINVACYAICTPMMTKIVEGGETSIFSMLFMMLVSVGGTRVGDKIVRSGNKAGGIIIGVFCVLAGMTVCVLDAVDVLYVPGFKVMSTMTGDSLFFIAVYVLSDVFSEVFGYKASRISANTAAMFSLVVGIAGKLLTQVPVPEYAAPNEAAFSFIYGGGIYANIAGVIIFMIGDMCNDKVFKKFKSKTSARSDYGSFSLRSICSSFVGKSVDLALFSLLVMVPFSTPAICELLGMSSWGMNASSLLGNFILGITLQITIETSLSPVSYIISKKIRHKIESDNLVTEQSNAMSLNS